MASLDFITATTSSASISSADHQPIPGLELSDETTRVALIVLSVGYFWMEGLTNDQDQGVGFSITVGRDEIAVGGYSWPHELHTRIRMPITLAAASPIGAPSRSKIVANWWVYGEGVTATIDHPSTLTACYVRPHS